MKLAACFVTLVCVVSAHAGFDGYYVVSKIQGKAQARSMMEHGQHRPGPWHDVHVGELINPPSQIRTGSKCRLWLQSGSIVRQPPQIRKDEVIDTYEIAPNSLVRTNGSRWNGPRNFIVLKGRAKYRREHGTLPAWKGS